MKNCKDAIDPSTRPTTDETAAAMPTPWVTTKQAAGRAQVGPKTIYREVRAGRLQAARVGGRREIRIHLRALDQWLEGGATSMAVQAK